MKIPFPKYDPDLVAEIEMFLDQDYRTEIVNETQAGADEDGLVNTWARGFDGAIVPSIGGARNPSNYARPMFEVLPAGYRGLAESAVRIECPACYDFSRSWNCPEHREVPYGTSLKSFVRPGAGNAHRVQPLEGEDPHRGQLRIVDCACAMCTGARSPITDELNRRRQTREVHVETFVEDGSLSAFSYRVQTGD